jgi:hypothetical protein
MLLCAIGCAGLYQSTITITSVVDTTMRSWADLSTSGKTSPQIDAKVKHYHDLYRDACMVAQASLIEFKRTGNQDAYTQGLYAARVAAQNVLNVITPLLNHVKAKELNVRLSEATAP